MTRIGRKIVRLVAVCLAGSVALAGGGSGRLLAATTLANVPAYNWYHGCGPTAAAAIVGYYDVLGYDGLFDASGWSDVKLTANVQGQISSPAHNAKYDPKPDDPNLPVPPNTSLACWFGTSVGSLDYGWSYVSKSDDAFEGYATYRGYECDSWYRSYNATTWADVVGEIDAGRPLMFLVDTDGNGGTDHFVPVFGYDDRGVDGLWYGCYTTWSESESIAWKRYRAMGSTWGVGYATFVNISARDGDVDTDGAIAAADIDALADAIRLHLPYDELFDLSADGLTAGTDGLVDINDLDYLVRFLVETDIGTGTEYGDFNLDGLVDTTDLTRLGTNYGPGSMWAEGNANRYIDLMIDTTDLTMLGTYFGFDASVDAIPEPATTSLLALGAIAMLKRRRDVGR